MSRTLPKAVKVLSLAAVGLVGVMLTAVVLADWLAASLLPRLIERQTGYRTTIGEGVETRLLTAQPGVTASGITLFRPLGPSGAEAGPLARIGRIEVGIPSWPSLLGPLVLSRVRLDDVAIDLNRLIKQTGSEPGSPAVPEHAGLDPPPPINPDAQSVANRFFRMPTIESIEVSDLRLRYRDPHGQAVQVVMIDSLSGSLDPLAQSFVKADGTVSLGVPDRPSEAAGAFGGELRFRLASPMEASGYWHGKALPIDGGLLRRLMPQQIGAESGESLFEIPARVTLAGELDVALASTPYRQPAPNAGRLLSAVRIQQSHLSLNGPDGPLMALSAGPVSDAAGTSDGDEREIGVDLMMAAPPYRFEGSLRGAPSSLRSAGQAPFELRVSAQKQGLDPVSLRASGHREADAANGADSASTIIIESATLRMADMALEGEGRYRWGSGPAQGLSARVHSDRIDVDRVLAVGEAYLPKDAGAQASAPTPGLSDLDVHLEYTVDRLTYREASLGAVSGAADFHDGVGQIDVDGSDDGGGTLALEAKIDTRGDFPRGTVNVALAGMSAPLLGKLAGLEWPPAGDLSGEIGLALTKPREGGESVESSTTLDRMLRAFALQPSTLDYRAPTLDSDLRLTLTGEAAGSRSAIEPGDNLVLRGTGTYAGDPFQLDARLAPPDAVVGQEPYSFDIRLTALRSNLRANGSVSEPLRFEGLDIDFEASGPNPNLLSPLLGIPLPSLPAYKLTGEITRDGKAYLLRRFDATVGRSDVQGDIRFIPHEEAPQLYANLISRELDLDDLAGLVGGAPTIDESSSARQRRLAARRAQSPYFLPRLPLNLQKIPQAFNGRVVYHAKTVMTRQVPLADFGIVMQVGENELLFDPVSFKLAGGQVDITLDLANMRPTPEGTVEVTARAVDLAKLLPPTELTDNTTGIIAGRAKLWVRGDSIGDLLGTADGGVYLLMTGGTVNEMLLELAGIDPGEALMSALFGDGKPVQIDCAWLDALAKAGRFEITTALVDTSDTLVVGDGSFNLEEESLDLVLEPRPKDFSLFSMPTPLHVRGTMKSPTVTPDASMAGTIAATGLLAAAAGPLAAALPLITPGESSDSARCASLTRQVDAAKDKRGRR